MIKQRSYRGGSAYPFVVVHFELGVVSRHNRAVEVGVCRGCLERCLPLTGAAYVNSRGFFCEKKATCRDVDAARVDSAQNDDSWANRVLAGGVTTGDNWSDQ